ncbi:MAG: small acid-soluble spore protein Tlp [Syntrophomonadaceae bacterium]
MKHKPDDRRDNVEKIQENIDNTLENIELAEETMAHNHNVKMRKAIKAKNIRREEALDNMRQEIRDEALDRERGYKE